MRVAAVAALLIVAGLAAQAAGAPSTKYFYVSATPTSTDISTTTTVPITFTLGNCGSGDVSAGRCAKASTQSVGSAHVTLPTPWSWGYAIGDSVSVTVSTSSKSSHWSNVSTASVATAGTVIQLANDGTSSAYALAPGEFLTFTATLMPSPGGLAQTTTQAKQSNDFSGTGNDFINAGSSPVITIGVPDHLEFGVPPQAVQVTTGTTDTHFMCDVAGNGPTVRVVDRNGQLVTWISPTPVTLSSSGSPGLKLNGSLSLTATTVDGVATFGSACSSGLTASALGVRYLLSASANNGALTVPPGSRRYFDVVQLLTTCTTDLCDSGDITGTDTTARVRAPSATGHRLAVYVGDPSGFGGFSGCDTDGTQTNKYRQLVGVDVQSGTKTVTLKWSKRAVQWAVNNGTPFWDVCMWAPYQFTTKGGGQATLAFTDTTTDPSTLWYTGLLPTCDVAGPPCIARLYKVASEQYADLTLPAGDPQFR